MASDQAAVNVVGLDPTSTTATFSNNVSSSKPTVQVLMPFNIALYYSIILHDILLSFLTRILGTLVGMSRTCLCHQVASLDCVPSQNWRV